VELYIFSPYVSMTLCLATLLIADVFTDLHYVTKEGVRETGLNWLGIGSRRGHV